MGFATYGSSNASESVGQTLVAPLITGTSYSITFWAKKSPSGFYSQNCSGVEFYGWVGNPVTGGSSVGVCPSSFPGSFLLGSSAMVSNDLWQQFQVDFTAPANIDFVAMCTGCANCPEYIHVDNFNFVATTNSFTFTTVCFGDSTHFTAPAGVTGLNSSLWNFGDPASGAQNTSALLNPTHLFSTSGNFTVQLILNYTNGTSDTMTNTVTVNAYPTVNLGNDTLICTAQPLTLDAQNVGSSYLWSTSVATQTISVSTTGTYAVTVTTGSCASTDSIDVTFALGASLNLGNDTTLCNGSSLTLNAFNAGSTYLWSTGVTTQTVTASQTGTYVVQVTNVCGVVTDSIHIIQSSSPSINLGNDTSICFGQILLLDVTLAGATYLWQNASTNPTYTVQSAGNYAVTVTEVNGCSASSNIDVAFNNSLIVQIGNDTTLCNGSTLTLNAGNSGGDYLWSNGETTQSVTVSQTATYIVQVTNLCGTAADSIIVTEASSPQINLGNDTSFCGDFTVNYIVNCTGCNYLWSDNSVTPQVTLHSPGIVTVAVSNYCGADKDTVVINAAPVPYVTLPNDTMLCIPEGYSILANTNAKQFLWSTGDTTIAINIPRAGKYWIDVNNNCGTDVDTINITQCPGEYIMPNAFSPNSDGKNDFIFPIRIGNASLLQYDIYNRWGQQVFTYANGDSNWDGKYNDSPCGIGVYIYIVRYKDNVYGTVKILQGNLTLLR